VTRKSDPQQEDAWDELCQRVQGRAGLPLRTTSLPEVIEAVLEQIDLGASAHKQKSLVRLASVLIPLEAAPLSRSEATASAISQQQLVPWEQARRCAEALVLQQELRGPAIPRPKPTIGEPEEPVSVTIFDLVRVIADVLKASKAAKPKA
jgi:hypothetical protein